MPILTSQKIVEPAITLSQRLKAQTICNNKLQSMVNHLSVSHQPVKDIILAIAMSAHAEFPQFENHWDDWVVVRIKRDVTTKLGQTFSMGDRTIMKLPETKLSGRTAVYYSIRAGWDVELPRWYSDE